MPLSQDAITQQRVFRLLDLTKRIDTLQPVWRIMSLALIVVAGLAVRLCFIGAAGDTDDIATFVRWYHSALTYPPSELYGRDRSINYPPAFACILELTAYAYRSLVHADPHSLILRTFIKLPAILFDLVGVVVAYVLVRRLTSPDHALAAAAFFAFNPAIIYISAYWGQLDSVPTVLALAAVLLLLSGISTLAWPLLVFAALVKPPVLILVPLFLIFPSAAQHPPERKHRFLGTSAGVLLALGLTELLAFLYFPHPTILAPTLELLTKLRQGSSLFPFTSLNAFNLWAIFQDFFAPDHAHWGPVIMKYWAQALFVVVEASICAAYALRRSTNALLEAATLLFLAFFLFMPEMHERYQIYATTFAGVLMFRPRYSIAAAVLSITTLLSLEYAMTYMYLFTGNVTAVNINEFSPMLVRLCALANLGAFVWLAACYVAPLKRAVCDAAASGLAGWKPKRIFHGRDEPLRGLGKSTAGRQTIGRDN